jgi:hypothetical protein
MESEKLSLKFSNKVETKSLRIKSILIGALFLIAMAVYMAGSEMVAMVLNNVFKGQAFDATLLRTGVVLEFLNSAAVIGIAVLLHPILEKFNKESALIYVVGRSLEAVLLLASSVFALVLAYASPGAVQLSGTILLETRDLLFQTAMVVLGASSIFLCEILLKRGLVPRTLAILGLVGYIMLMFSGFMGLFGFQDQGMLLFIPGALFEIGFPLWLIIKGFKLERLQTEVEN